MIIHQRFPSVPASVIQVIIQQGQVLVTDNVQVIRNDREYQSLQKSLLSKKLKCVSKRYLNTSHQIYSGHPGCISHLLQNFVEVPNQSFFPFFKKLHNYISSYASDLKSLATVNRALVMRSAVAKGASSLSKTGCKPTQGNMHHYTS